MTRRFFTDSERWTLYRNASGRCQICGMELHGVFHADHIKPYSLGGMTTLDNGQVLCERCNMEKSNKYADLPEWYITPRDWQNKAFNRWLAMNGQNVLINATPGAGKTTLGLKIARHELQSGNVSHVMIVTPSDNLRRQWQVAASAAGIELFSAYDANFELASDFHGIVTTYQTLAARYMDADKSYRKFTESSRTLAILDEIHHIGVGMQWSNGLRDAVDPCPVRLILTGTPFRSDRNPLPYVEYEVKGDEMICKTHFDYGYGDALRDRVVRPVYFQTFDGQASWFTGDGEFIDTGLDVALPAKLAAERRNMMLDHRGDWLRKVLQAAHEKLMEIRQYDPKAGGLVVAKDSQNGNGHAWQIAKLLETITGKKPVVVTSDVDDASKKINAFRNGRDEWIVAVKMVSEGVDIKRLRVGVWATNVTTELFFRQVVGRIVRRVDAEEEENAFQFIPKVEPITTYANSMKIERAHVIDDLNAIDEETWRKIREEFDRNSNPALFVSSDGERSIVIHDDDKYTVEEMEEAKRMCAELGTQETEGYLIHTIKLMRMLGTAKAPAQKPATNGKPNERRPQTLEEQKQAIRRRKGPISRLMAAIVEASNGMCGYNEMNRTLNQNQNVKHVDECPLPQLEQRVEILEAWLEAWKNGTGRQFTVKGYLRQRPSDLAA